MKWHQQVLPTENTDIQPSHKSQLNDKENKTELRELSTHYILQQVASNQHDNITLIDYFSLAYNIPTPEYFELRELSTHYILHQVANNQHDNITLNIYYFSLTYIQHSHTRMLLDQRCDDKETLLNVISELYEEFIVPKRTEWVLLEGDQATYQRLQCIKAEYGSMDGPFSKKNLP